MKTRIILVMSFGAILLAIAGRIFLFTKVTSSPQNSDFQANIQWPSWTYTKGNTWSYATTASRINAQDKQNIEATATWNNTGYTVTSGWLLPSENSTGIRILFPPRVAQQDITALTMAVRQIVDIQANAVRAESMQAYETARQASLSSTNQDRDIILVSTFNGQDSINASKHIPFTTDISGYFSPLVGKLIRSTSWTFVPYAIDPLVTIIHRQINTNPKSFSRDLLQHTIASPRTLPSDIPHLWSLFGVSPTDILLGRNNKEAYPWYTEILSIFTEQAIQTKTAGILTYLSQIPSREFWVFRDITHLVSEKFPQCTTFPIQCILRYQLGDIWFTHLSDLDILRMEFPQWDRREQNYTITNFPTSNLWYPITARWFIIPKKVKSPASAYERIRGYLLLATQQRLISSSYTLSPFAELLETQLLQSIYRNLSDQITYGYLSQFNLATQENKLRQQLRDVLDQRYNAQLFLRTYEKK